MTLAAGPNVTIVPSGNTLTIGAAGDNNAWLLAGNSGTSPGPNFLGTTDSQPLELHVNNQRALRLEPNVSGPFGAPNVIGGSANNSVSAGVNNAFIGGGYYNTINAANSAIVGGNQNQIADTNSFIGGGENHRLLNASPTMASLAVAIQRYLWQRRCRRSLLLDYRRG